MYPGENLPFSREVASEGKNGRGREKNGKEPFKKRISLTCVPLGHLLTYPVRVGSSVPRVCTQETFWPPKNAFSAG
jgi:hypothetical protein